MNASEIKSSVSIKFGLSSHDADAVVSSVFNFISSCFEKGKNLDIPSFGKFKSKVSSSSGQNHKTVSFIPSSKLERKVNLSFDNLENVKLKFENLKLDNDEESTDYDYKEVHPKAHDTHPKNKAIQRTLISDAIVKLHNEITNDDLTQNLESNEPETPDTNKKNLWG